MTMSSNRHEPIFDIHPVTGASIEVFYADTALATFGRGGAGWFWQCRRRGFAPEGKATGPFPTSYTAYRHAVVSRSAGFAMKPRKNGCCASILLPRQQRMEAAPLRIKKIVLGPAG
jgi:hypothetical protein